MYDTDVEFMNISDIMFMLKCNWTRLLAHLMVGVTRPVTKIKKHVATITRSETGLAGILIHNLHAFAFFAFYFVP